MGVCCTAVIYHTTQNVCFRQGAKSRSDFQLQQYSLLPFYLFIYRTAVLRMHVLVHRLTLLSLLCQARLVPGGVSAGAIMHKENDWVRLLPSPAHRTTSMDEIPPTMSCINNAI